MDERHPGHRRLYAAARGEHRQTEANFLEVLRGCDDFAARFRDSLGKTVLMEMASNHDWPVAATAVIERGYDVNATDTDGWSALHFTGVYNRHETARILLERGADRTIKTKGGKTAADWARVHGHFALATYIEGFVTPPPPPDGSEVKREPDAATDWAIARDEASAKSAATEEPHIKQEDAEARRAAVDAAAVADAHRAQEKERTRVRKAAAAAAADGVEIVGEVENLAGPAAPARFTPDDEQKPCPRCSTMVVISRKRQRDALHCGNGHCRGCDAEFCWECLHIFDDARASRSRTETHFRAQGGLCRVVA